MDPKERKISLIFNVLSGLIMTVSLTLSPVLVPDCANPFVLITNNSNKVDLFSMKVFFLGNMSLNKFNLLNINLALEL